MANEIITGVQIAASQSPLITGKTEMSQHTELINELRESSVSDSAWNLALRCQRASDALQAMERVLDVETLIDDLSEWSRHVVEDTAHESLEKHVKRVLAHHGITPPESI